MTLRQKDLNAVHPAALMYAGEVRAGTLSRREFLTRTTALGVSVAGIVTAPPVAWMRETVPSVESTAKQVVQPFGAPVPSPPRPPSGWPPVAKVV